MLINGLTARKILNSNSNFTIEVKLSTHKGLFRGSSPAGESTSKYEVSQFSGGIDSVVDGFNKFLSTLKNKKIETVDDIFGIERSISKEFIGGPSLSLSYALIYGLSNDLSIEPYELFGGKNEVTPVCKILGGGVHASGLSMDMQEILVMTLADSINERVESTLAVYKDVKDELKKKNIGFLGGVDPEGGFVTGMDDYESLALVKKSVEKIAEERGSDIRIGIDAAASTFFKDGKYHYKKPLYGKRLVTREEQSDMIVKLAEEFDIYYIEDPVDEDFPDGYKYVKDHTKALVIGDDMTATVTERLEKVHDSINSTLIKPNQVGTIEKVVEYSKLADKYGLSKVMSHRSEETPISIITDIGIGLAAKYLKIGINRGERTEKINRLMELN